MSNYNSVLIFKDYIVNTVEYKRNPKFKKDKNEIPVELSITPLIESNEKKLKVTLETKIFESSEENNYPFEMAISITGNFEAEGDEPRKFEKNAIAIMYPYVRAIVSTYTASANISPLILPAINVNKLIEEQEENRKK